MKSLIPIIFFLGIYFPGLTPGSGLTKLLPQTPLPNITTSPGLRCKLDVLSVNEIASSSPVPAWIQIPFQSTALSFEPRSVPSCKEDLFSDRLLPDLHNLPPTDLHLVYDVDSGRALIRFSNSIWNSGPGKLELVGTPNQQRDRIRVSQRVYAADQERFDEIEVGEFIFHGQHNHWHLKQFAVYEVWSVDERGSLKSMISSGGKISYCIMDVSLSETNNSDKFISTNRSYAHCEEEIQGLSVGWIDTYKYYYWGQWVDVTSLEDGIYALVSTVDPNHLLREADTNNNTGVTYFGLREKRLRVVKKRLLEYDGYLIPNAYRKP